MALTTCSFLDFDEDSKPDAMVSAVARVFGVTIPSKDAGSVFRCARQNRSPNEFAIIKVQGLSDSTVAQFETSVSEILGYEEKVDSNPFTLRPNNLAWWNYKDVTMSRHYRIVVHSEKSTLQISVYFPQPVTGSVYLEVGGVDWETAPMGR